MSHNHRKEVVVFIHKDAKKAKKSLKSCSRLAYLLQTLLNLLNIDSKRLSVLSPRIMS